jgi:hypothetical protein
LISAIAGHDPFSRLLAGKRLNELVGLEDARVRKAVIDGGALAPGRDEPGAAEDGEMLAHVRDLAADLTGKVTDGLLATGETLQDAQPLGISQGAADGSKALSLEVG